MSVELPRALKPWAEPLALFGDVVHDGVGRWLHPLRSLLGPLVVPGAATTGEPDGHAGLRRRGSYERLLLSEWALALEAPDEFLRRATTGEHVFMAPAYREPKASNASVALMDCGPRQLGAPRLAHLAALVVLRQRAELGSASFQFGVLQDEQGELRTLDPLAIPWWLRHRTTQTAEGSGYLSDWRTQLEELDPPDLWLVGGPDLRETAARLGASLLEVEESMTSTERTLHVRTWRPGRVGGAIALPLPPSDACVRILRAPLAPRRQSPRDDGALRPEELGQLSVDGRRWLLPRPDGGVNALHVPNTPAEAPGYPKQVLPLLDSTLIAVDIKGKRPVALAVSDDGELLVRGSGLMLMEGRSSRSVGEAQAVGIPAPESMLSDSGRMLSMYVTHADALHFRAWIHDHEGQLWELVLMPDPRYHPKEQPWVTQELVVRDRACRQLHRLGPTTVAWVSDSAERVLSSPQSDNDDGLVLSQENRDGCVLGPLRAHDPAGLRYAYAEGEDLVHNITPRGTIQKVMRPEGRVFGLAVCANGTEGEDALVLFVGPQGQCVYSREGGDGGDCRLLFTATHTIAAIRHEPVCGKILWRTEGGERGVYDMLRDAVLRRLAPPGPEDEP